MNYIYIILLFLVIAVLALLPKPDFNMSGQTDLVSGGCSFVNNKNACKGFYVANQYSITNLKNKKVPATASYQLCCPDGVSASQARIAINVLQIEDNLNVLNSESGIQVDSKGELQKL